MVKESEIESEIETPEFRPTMQEFANFANFIKKLEELNISFAKIIPPNEWQAQSKTVDPNYNLQMVVNQVGENLLGGAFSISTDSTQMAYARFEEISKEEETKLTGLSVKEIEDIHWMKMCSERKYAINNKISLFGNVRIWNLDRFTKTESNIHSTQPHYNCDNVMDGIQSPYLFIGGPLTSFAFHLEDGNANSINFLHRGAIKVWYFILPGQNKKLENLSKKLTKNVDCDFFIRHKTMMIPPSVLKKHKIKFARVLQNPGEFVVSLTGAYHSGFNCGMNQAEAMNFGSEKWLQFFDKYITCNCSKSLSYDSPAKAIAGLSKIVQKLTTKYVCEECGSTFSENKNLNLHTKNQHGAKLPCFICPILCGDSNELCGAHYNAPYPLRKHLKDKHNLNMNLDEVKEFNHPMKNSLKVKNAKAVKRANPYIRKSKTCTDCGKSFAGSFNFDRHLPKCGTEIQAVEQSDGSQLVGIIHTNATLLESVIGLAPIPDISEASIVVEDNTNAIQHESVEDFEIGPESPQSKNLLGDSSICPLTTQSDQEPTSPISGKPLSSAEKVKKAKKVKRAQKRRQNKPVEPKNMSKKAMLIPNSSIPAKIQPKFRIPKIDGTKKAEPAKHMFSGSLRMKPLPAHLIPEDFFDIEANNNNVKFSVFQESVQQVRTNEQQYINAFKGMLYMNETVESEHLLQYRLTNVKIIKYSSLNRMVKVKYDETMPNFKRAVSDSTIDALSIAPAGVEQSTIDGRIQVCDQNYIYIKIAEGFEELSLLNRNSMQFFDINFHMNQTPYQLQLQALDFLVEHQLFEILINNPLYSMTVEEDPMHSQIQLSCTYGNELNDEQKNAIKNIAGAYCRPAPYLLFGPAGTGKTKTLVSAIEHIVRSTNGHILVCAFSNSACDEVAERLLGVLSESDVLRMYAKSFKKTSLKAKCEKICNLQNGEFIFPPLDHIYKFKVVVCTLLFAGCLVRANGFEANFSAKHFSHIFIDESACTHETESLTPIAGLCTEPNVVHSCIVLSGDPMQLDAVTKSKYADVLGFSTSYMETLFKMPLYQPHPITKKFNAKYITHLVKNYRSHDDILKVPNELFYKNKLEVLFKDQLMVTHESDLLLNGNSRVIFNAIKGVCQKSDTKSSYNIEEANLVVDYIEEIQAKIKINGEHLQETDIGIVSPYGEQCKNILTKLNAKGYNEITVGSAETFQGQERKVIVVSTVRTGENLGFVNCGKRFNVMMTRPGSLLIIVGDHEALYSNEFWKKQIDHCQSLGSLIKDGRKLNPRIRVP